MKMGFQKGFMKKKTPSFTSPLQDKRNRDKKTYISLFRKFLEIEIMGINQNFFSWFDFCDKIYILRVEKQI